MIVKEGIILPDERDSEWGVVGGGVPVSPASERRVMWVSPCRAAGAAGTQTSERCLR